MTLDFATQVDILLRLVVAAVLGAVVGIEREIHDHPAGMRTHLLVSIGSAAFTVLSIYGFGSGDPSRVAAQIVTGIGFLGAGAILKEGATVKGLTTAASLWAVAAIGMAAGAGIWLVALATTFIVVFSLWPLRVASKRFVASDREQLRAELTLADPSTLPRVVAMIADHGGRLVHLGSRPSPRGGLVVDLDLRLPDSARRTSLAAALAAVDGAELQESASGGD